MSAPRDELADRRLQHAYRVHGTEIIDFFLMAGFPVSKATVLAAMVAASVAARQALSSQEAARLARPLRSVDGGGS